MATAQIVFTQGVSVSPPSTSLMGVAAVSVQVASNITLGIVTFIFTVIDVPPGSAVPVGLVQTGASPTWNFTPDLQGGYCVELETIDGSGNTSTDTQVFGVPTTTGRFIPPFTGNAQNLNFAGQTRGWAPYMEAWLHFLDTLGEPFTRVTTAGGHTLIAADDKKYFLIDTRTGPLSLPLPTVGLFDGLCFFFKDAYGMWGQGTNDLTLAGDASHKIEDIHFMGVPGAAGSPNASRFATSVDCDTEGMTIKVRWDATQGAWLTMTM